MKKNLKINNKLKLNLGITKTWAFINMPLQNQKDMQSSLKLFQNIQSFFLFSGRSVNLYFRYYFFQLFFQRWGKLLFLRKKKKSFKFFFFFKQILKKKKIMFFFQKKIKVLKKLYLSTFLNYFSSLHFSLFSVKFEKNFLLIFLNVNLCFFRKRGIVYFFKNKLSKRIIQKFLFLKFKFLLEHKLQHLVKFPVILNLKFFHQVTGQHKKILQLLQKKKYERIKLKKFSNYWQIKTLHKIQKDIISNLLFAFYSLNAQLIADQFALGINRTRKQNQFIFWFDSLLKYYRFFGFNIAALKIIIFGKIAGKPRTKILKLHYGRYTIKTQTLALKVNYGYSSAETYTGSFGIHIWLYQRDSIIVFNYINYINQKLGLL